MVVESHSMHRQTELFVDKYGVFIRSAMKELEDGTWVCEEDYLPMHIYNAFVSGDPSVIGEWSDGLRRLERERLYDHADRMVSKYSTDVPDEDKRSAWVAYKAAVRATQDAPGYPADVTYPDMPE